MTARSYAISGKVRCRMHGGAAGSGAPVGPRNGSWKHGKFSIMAKAERDNINRDRWIVSQAWFASQPKTDYAKLCRDLEALRRKKRDA